MPRSLSSGSSAGVQPRGLGGNGLFANRRIYTADATFVVPDGVHSVYVTAIGGGGGGAGYNSSAPTNQGGGGGGSGSLVYRKLVPVTPGASVAITVGAGGAGGAAGTPRGAGGNGGNTTFASEVTARGGSGGQASDGAGAGVGGAYNPSPPSTVDYENASRAASLFVMTGDGLSAVTMAAQNRFTTRAWGEWLSRESSWGWHMSGSSGNTGSGVNGGAGGAHPFWAADPTQVLASPSTHPWGRGGWGATTSGAGVTGLAGMLQVEW